VSYPTAAIVEQDPFDGFETTGIKVQTDANSVVKSWSFPSPEADGHGDAETDMLIKSDSATQKQVRKRPSRPPFLEFRFPFNYVGDLGLNSLCLVSTDNRVCVQLAIPIIPIVVAVFVISA
jgi:hypothetical protein